MQTDLRFRLRKIRGGVGLLGLAPYGAHAGIICALISLEREVIHRPLAFVHTILGRLKTVLHIRNHGLIRRKGIRLSARNLADNLRGDRASE